MTEPCNLHGLLVTARGWDLHSAPRRLGSWKTQQSELVDLGLVDLGIGT